MTNLSAFEYNGVDVAINVSNEQMSLTDLWKAAGSPANKDPRQWKRKEGKAFIKAVAKKLNVPEGHIIVSTRGKGGSTFGHWQIAMAYAKYANDDLHMHCNDIVRRYFQADVSLATDIVERSQDIDAIKHHQIRTQTKITRRAATDDLQAHGVVKFGMVTNRLYQGLFDATADQLRAKKNLPAKANVREAMDADELTDTLFGERLLRKRLKDRNAQGDKECAKAAFDAGLAIRKLVEE